MIGYVVISLIALLSYAGLLVLVFRYGVRGHRANQMFAFYLFDMLLQQLSYLMLSMAGTERAALLWYTFTGWFTVGQGVLYFFFTKAFLELPPPRRWIQITIFTWLAGVVFGTFFHPDFFFTHIYRHEVTGLFIPEVSLWGLALLVPVMVFWCLTVYYLSGNYAAAQSSLRRVRIQYVLLSVMIVWFGLVANGFSALRPYPVDVGANIAAAFLLAYAILRYRLLDIAIVIRKVLFYLVSVVVMGVGYFAVIMVATRLFRNLGRAQSLLLSLVLAALAALIGQPFRERVYVWIDRTFFRDKYDGNLMIQRLGGIVTSVLDLQKLAGLILHEITQTMHIQWAAFFLEHEGVFRLIAQQGPEAAAGMDLAPDHSIIRWLSSHKTLLTVDILDALLAQDINVPSQAEELKRIGVRMFIPLIARDKMVGALGLGAKVSRYSYTQDDERTLLALANQVSVAIDNARLYEAVQQELVERKRAEESLRQSEEKYRLVAENVADIVWITDLAFNMRYVSPSVTRVRGYTVAEAVQQRLEDILAPASLALGLRVFDEVMERERIGAMDPDLSQTLEFEEYCRDGSTIWTENTLTFLRDAAGTPIGIVGITRDITERKEAEAERERLIAELEAKNAELERFTYTVSHDLKSPLITLKGFLGFLEQDMLAGHGERVHSDITHLNNAADKMRQLLDGLLELSRIGRLMNPPEALSFELIVREAIELVQGRIAARGADVAVAPDLPVVCGDRARLVAVVQNLLDNACKFMEGQPHPRIEVGVRQTQDDPVFFVRDNGIGIDQQHYDKVFGLFEKLDPASEGTGIGLAIVKRIIETHNGCIWVESEGLGRGSAFCFTLPYNDWC